MTARAVRVRSTPKWTGHPFDGLLLAAPVAAVLLASGYVETVAAADQPLEHDEMTNEKTTGSAASPDAAGGRVDCPTGCQRFTDTAPITAPAGAQRGPT